MNAAISETTKNQEERYSRQEERYRRWERYRRVPRLSDTPKGTKGKQDMHAAKPRRPSSVDSSFAYNFLVNGPILTIFGFTIGIDIGIKKSI